MIRPRLFSGRASLLWIRVALFRVAHCDPEFWQPTLCAQVPLHSCVRALCAVTHLWVSRPQCRPRTALWDSSPRSNFGSRRSIWTSASGSLSKPPPDSWLVAPSRNVLRTPHCPQLLGPHPFSIPFGVYFRWTRAAICTLICEVSGRACRFLRAVVRKLAARLPFSLVDAAQADGYSRSPRPRLRLQIS